MALRLYHDAACTQEITAANPDTVRKAVPVGAALVDEQRKYFKSDDPDLTYENNSITGDGDEDGADEPGEVDVEYALDIDGSPGEYQQTLDLPDGDYAEPFPIWRRVTAPAVAGAFRRIDITHRWTQNEYVK